MTKRTLFCIKVLIGILICTMWLNAEKFITKSYTDEEALHRVIRDEVKKRPQNKTLHAFRLRMLMQREERFAAIASVFLCSTPIVDNNGRVKAAKNKNKTTEAIVHNNNAVCAYQFHPCTVFVLFWRCACCEFLLFLLLSANCLFACAKTTRISKFAQGNTRKAWKLMKFIEKRNPSKGVQKIKKVKNVQKYHFNSILLSILSKQREAHWIVHINPGLSAKPI